MIRRILFAIVAALFFAIGNVGTVTANATLEERCQEARLKASEVYVSCKQNALKIFEGRLRAFNGEISLRKQTKLCQLKYQLTWPKLQVEFPGTSCEAVRFIDNADGTVIDNLSGLQWEKKDSFDSMPNLVDPHDADNLYTWSATGVAGDGTAFTDLLKRLNDNCFAGQCDWRLPSLAELQGIEEVPPDLGLPCAHTGCLDPKFGPNAFTYWTTTAVLGLPEETDANATDLSAAIWVVDFIAIDEILAAGKIGNPSRSVRAVRGGF